jgi:hypothetical protein
MCEDLGCVLLVVFSGLIVRGATSAPVRTVQYCVREMKHGLKQKLNPALGNSTNGNLPIEYMCIFFSIKIGS